MQRHNKGHCICAPTGRHFLAPKLAPIIARLLAEAGHGELDDAIAKVYPIAPPSAKHQMRERLKNGEAGTEKASEGAKFALWVAQSSGC